VAAQPPKIVVAGDVAIDWLQWPIASQDFTAARGKDGPKNWELVPGHRMVARPGGALLLAKFVAQATGTPVTTHVIKDPLGRVPPEEVLHSLSFLNEHDWFSDKEKQSKERKRVYRITELHGFVGPAKGSPDPLSVKGAPPKADLVVLDDAGNGFRFHPKLWPATLQKRGARRVVLKMSHPLAEGDLWDFVTKDYADDLVVVVNADDLRKTAGVDVSRWLSWEQTARDFVWQMAWNPSLEGLAKLRHLVVRFGIDGAIHYRCDGGKPTSRLCYDRAVIEGGYGDVHPGVMLGYTSAFVAAIAATVLKGGLPAVERGAKRGIACCRRLLEYGFGPVPKVGAGQRQFQPEYPIQEAMKPLKPKGPAAEGIWAIGIPDRLAQADAAGQTWSILASQNDEGKGDGQRPPFGHLEELAFEIVKKGVDAKSDKLARVPVAQFGKLKTADLSEMESLRSIQNLIREYHLNRSAKGPLCIAVFGPPGSGKSFAVKQVAGSLGISDIEPMEFNVSQFGAPDDLAKALHKVQDKVLSGVVPLVFFDEFDTTLGSEQLGWLKYFLMPMHDGRFLDGETEHPIGKAIFVFAGGTSSRFAKFCRETDASPEAENGETEKGAAEKKRAEEERANEEKAKEEFKQRKGPDFASRLRGYIDIMGPDRLRPDDDLAMIRRAVALRVQLEIKAKELSKLSEGRTRCLINSKGEAIIDEGVLRAFIHVPSYKHGMRSMQAILDMSLLAGRPRFEQAALPPPQQLDLHVDAKEFQLLMAHDARFRSAREGLATAFHEAYRRDQAGKQPGNAPAMQPWGTLEEHFKESNRHEADHILAKLKAAGYRLGSLLSRGRQATTFGSEEEVELLAKMEHARWVRERRKAGWQYGPKKDPVAKTHPCLVPWSKLKESERDKDRAAVRAIPKILAEAGFQMYRPA
jgi:hypothetical protein